MCLKYNLFLRSTCLHIVALSSLASFPAYGGFEWTPPDKIVPPAADMPETPPAKDTRNKDSGMGNSEKLLDYILNKKDALPVTPDIFDDTQPSADRVVLEEDGLDIQEQDPVVMKNILPTEEKIPNKKPPEVTANDQNDRNQNETETDSGLPINPYPVKETVATRRTPQPVQASRQEKPQNQAPAETVHWNKAASYEVIEGFGMEIPLALALSQIVPPEFAYSFGKGVDVGARVSWEGGKPWNEVLGETLNPLGAKAVVHEKTVKIKKDPEHITQKNKIPERIVSPASQKVEKKNDDDANSGADFIISQIDVEDENEDRDRDKNKNGAKIDLERVVINGRAVVTADMPEKVLVTTALEDSSNNKPTKDHAVITDAIILDKEILDKEREQTHRSTSEEAATSVMAEDLMQPLNTFQQKGRRDLRSEFMNPKPQVKDEDIAPYEADDTPLQRPEILLDKAQREEEEYARRIEKIKPYPMLEDPALLSEEPEETEPAENLNDKKHDEGKSAIAPPLSAASFDDTIEETPEINSPALVQEQINWHPTSGRKGDDPVRAKEGETSEETVVASLAEDPSSRFRAQPSGEVRIWRAREGTDLKTLLEEWSGEENIPLIWDLDDKYVLDRDVFISGTFKNAVNILFRKGMKRTPSYELRDAPYTLVIFTQEY
ncbi:MAG: TcpQ domain-containing protein [Alphaproteobacteria bacterium]